MIHKTLFCLPSRPPSRPRILTQNTESKQKLIFEKSLSCCPSEIPIKNSEGPCRAVQTEQFSENSTAATRHETRGTQTLRELSIFQKSVNGFRPSSFDVHIKYIKTKAEGLCRTNTFSQQPVSLVLSDGSVKSSRAKPFPCLASTSYPTLESKKQPQS
jgi:hypothetical protein